jgi:hypothetical protein
MYHTGCRATAYRLYYISAWTKKNAFAQIEREMRDEKGTTKPD